MYQSKHQHRIDRVAKCHGYDGYNRVKILAGWGKSLGEHAIWQNQAFLGKICTQYEGFRGINQLNLVGWSTVVLQKYPFGKFCPIQVPKQSLFMCFSLGKIRTPCKRIDILQLCLHGARPRIFARLLSSLNHLGYQQCLTMKVMRALSRTRISV